MQSLVDKYYCINLYERPDRYLSASQVFKKLNLDVIFYQTHKNPKSGAQGCYDSHLNVIRNAYNANYNRVCIFEDDVLPSKYLTNDNINYVKNFIDNNDYDIFYLGPRPDVLRFSINKISSEHKDKYIYTGKILCAHAYIINRKFMKQMLDNYSNYNNTTIDKVYRDTAKSYAIYPSLFYQNTLESDIRKDGTEKLGAKTDSEDDLMNRFRWAELYTKYINIPIINLIFLIILIIIIILIIYFYLKNK